MALAAALTVLMSLLPAGLASVNVSKSLTVTCTEGGFSQQKKEVTAAGTVLTVLCPQLRAIEPPVVDQKVCKTSACSEKIPLTNYSAKAADVEGPSPGTKITFEKLPETKETFYLQCKDATSDTCQVEVTLKPTTPPEAIPKPTTPPEVTLKPTTPPPKAPEQPAPPSGSGTPSVQICEQKNASITLKIPEQGSSAQFACESGFDLYPTDADEVFLKDCKTKETLSDMTRTQTPAAGTAGGSRTEQSMTYMLKADKKPSKKTLCYLCAKKGTSVENPGTAANYCTIYVESGARTQLDLVFTLVLALPCVLAVFQCT